MKIDTRELAGIVRQLPLSEEDRYQMASDLSWSLFENHALFDRSAFQRSCLRSTDVRAAS